MFIEKSSTIDLLKKVSKKNECTITMVSEACRTVPKLNIPEDALVHARIWKLIVGVCEAQTKLSKVQFELNLKITKLELRAQPSTPPESESSTILLSKMLLQLSIL